MIQVWFLVDSAKKNLEKCSLTDTIILITITESERDIYIYIYIYICPVAAGSIQIIMQISGAVP